MNFKRINLVVGLFVVAAFGILLVGVYFLKETVPGQRTQTLPVLFEQVSTLQTGDPVKVNGVRMGRVSAIRLLDRMVLAELRLEQGVAIPIDSDVRIQNIGLMGERQVGIHMGKSDRSATSQDTLRGRLDAGIAEALGVAGNVFVEAEDLVASLRSVVDSTVGRPEFSQAFNDLMAETRQLSRELDGFMSGVKPKVERSLDNVEVASLQVRRLMEEQNEPLRRIMLNSEEVSEKLKEVVHRGDNVAMELERLLRTVNSDSSTLGALIHDGAFYSELRSTLNSADSLFEQIRKKGLNVNLDLF